MPNYCNCPSGLWDTVLNGTPPLPHRPGCPNRALEENDSPAPLLRVQHPEADVSVERSTDTDEYVVFVDYRDGRRAVGHDVDLGRAARMAIRSAALPVTLSPTVQAQGEGIT